MFLRYINDPIIWQYIIASTDSDEASLNSFRFDAIGVAMQSIILNLFRISIAYFPCPRKIPSVFCHTSIPRTIVHRHIIGASLVFHFFLVAGRFYINDVTALVILFFNLKCRYLLFGTSLHSSFLVGDYVCGLSYKSNAIVWLEKFHKEYLYWQVLMHKWSCNYFSQYNIHPYLTETF